MKLAVGERNVATNLGTFSGCVKECCFIIIIIIINRRRVEQTWTSRPREVGHTGLQRVVETVDECVQCVVKARQSFTVCPILCMDRI